MRRNEGSSQDSGRSGVGALVLALTGVVDLPPHTGGSFTSAHLAFPLSRFWPLDIEGLSCLSLCLF